MSTLKTIKIDFGNNHCGYVFYTRNYGLNQQRDIIDDVIKESLQNSFLNRASISFEHNQTYNDSIDYYGNMYYEQVLQIEPNFNSLVANYQNVSLLRETFNVYFYDVDKKNFKDKHVYFHMDGTFTGTVSEWNNVKFNEWKNQFADVNFL